VVTPAAGLKYLIRPMSAIDPSLLRNARELVRPGDTVWDIGANVGLFAFSAAALSGVGGQVFAFEPDLWLTQLLRLSQTMQPPSNAPVTIVPAGVGAAVALRRFHISSRSRAANALAGHGSTQFGEVLEEQMIPVFNVDWLLENIAAPNVVKCDVEGAEVGVFANQRKILNTCRPVVVCEVSPNNAGPVTDLFHSNAYRLFDGEKPLSGAKSVERAAWNTIAIPEESIAKYDAASSARSE
jgi:FkbM family methyltransferase